MSFLFRNVTSLNKIILSKVFFASYSWMSMKHGEGEKEIENHGWSRVKSFSQETEAKGQQTPRIGAKAQAQSLKCRMHIDPLTQLPFFSFLQSKGLAVDPSTGYKCRL